MFNQASYFDLERIIGRAHVYVDLPTTTPPRGVWDCLNKRLSAYLLILTGDKQIQTPL